MNKFFYGWYFRCQSRTGTVAVIPAVHMSEQKQSCSIQVITEEGTWNVEFPIRQFRINRRKLFMKIGENVFSKKGMCLNLKDGDTRIRGVFQFHGFVKPKYDIMGPFRHIPMMECRHAVYSLQHLVNGHLWIGSKKLDMENAKGYMEGDSGVSFPDKYVWTQSFFEEGCIVLAAASIPLGALSFTGTIGIVRWKGREYRFATYLGATVLKMDKGELLIRQGGYQLKVKLLDHRAYALRAPVEGNMTRNILENVSCQASYSMTYRGKLLFERKTKRAAFEYEIREFEKFHCSGQEIRI